MHKKCWMSVFVVFVSTVVISIVIHGVLLKQEYGQFPNIFRTLEDHKKFAPLMLLAHFLFATGFVTIYLKGKEDKPFIGQGLRYGLIISILTTIPTYLIYFSVLPLSCSLVTKQIIFDTLGVLLLGVLTAWLNRV